jgi:hypothetical protein
MLVFEWTGKIACSQLTVFRGSTAVRGSESPWSWLGISHSKDRSLIVLFSSFICLFSFFLVGTCTVRAHGLESTLERNQYTYFSHIVFLLSFVPYAGLQLVHHRGSSSDVLAVAYNLAMGNNKLGGLYNVFWFVPCLFVTQQIMNFAIIRLRLLKVALFSAVCLAASYLTGANLHVSLPFDVNVVLAAVPIFCAGYFAKRLSFGSGWVYATAIAGTAFSAFSLWYRVDIEYDMKQGIYGIPFVSFLLSLCCILAVVYASRRILCIHPVAKVLSALGAKSMGIMFLHVPFAFLCSTAHLETNNIGAFSLLILCLSYVLTSLLSQFRFTRALYLV